MREIYYVVWHTDNQAVSSIAAKGSMVIELLLGHCPESRVGAA